jgi:hypothetical protein
MIVTEADPASLVALSHCACNLFLVQCPPGMKGEPVFSVRNVTLDDEALDDEVLDDEVLDDDGVTVDGNLVEEILFRVLLLCLGTSDESSELCGNSTL